MAVYKRTFKVYRGRLTPAWSRFLVLTRYGYSTLFQSRPFTAFTVLSLIPFLVAVGIVYLVHNAAVQTLLNVRMEQTLPIDNMFFLRFLAIEAWMGFVLTAWSAPGMVSKDFTNDSIQLYLSRPFSRAEYLLGKISVLGGLLSLITWIPGLLVFLVQAQMEGHGWGWDHLWLAGAIVLSALLWIALVSLLAMAISVWVRWRIAATALLIAIILFLPAFSAVINAVLRTKWGFLLNYSFDIIVVWSHLFRTYERHLRPDAVPVWAAWMVLLSTFAFCLWLLNRRLKAREVVSA